jgi:hypothetical protein
MAGPSNGHVLELRAIIPAEPAADKRAPGATARRARSCG